MSAGNFRLAQIGVPGQAVDPLNGGDVDTRTGRPLSVQEIRDALTYLWARPVTDRRTAPAAAAVGVVIDETVRVPDLGATPVRPRRRSVGPDATTGLLTAVLPPAAVYVVGASGGCGESTVAAMLPDAVATGRCWPAGSHDRRVLLVARTTMTSLVDAQRAIGQWASGAVPGITLLGLVLVADAPGGELRPVADFIRLLAGGVPHLWRIPWVRHWRLQLPDPTDPTGLPRGVAAIARDIASHYSPVANRLQPATDSPERP